MSNSYKKYLEHNKKHTDLQFATALLYWDKEVYLPRKGNRFRAQQLATLSAISHEMMTNRKYGKLIEDLFKNKKSLSPAERRNIDLSYKDYIRNKSFSEKFVIKRSQAISTAFDAWIKARAANDWTIYQKPLQEIVELKREEAKLVGFKQHPYNALLEEYEPGATVGQLDKLFSDVRRQLVDFVAELRSKKQVDDTFLYKKWRKDKQWDYGLDILKKIGYDFEAGRQDVSEHPFTISFSPEDVRVTTRVDEKNFGNMLWSCIHEGGHALYEQGIPTETYGTPIGNAVSLAIHESQSRLWENNVGRGLPFWKANFKELKKQFPKNLEGVSLQKFYKGINKITPSPIRTESDELHYHFHVLIRYEIEKGLIEDSLDPAELRTIWNDRYQEYLGLEIKDDKTGILQDIHWSHGSIGYFPTYSLGSFYAAQFFAQAKKDIPNLEERISEGDNQLLLDWLRKNIHQHGARYNPNALCKRVTGETLNFKYFMDYVKEKYGGIYK